MPAPRNPRDTRDLIGVPVYWPAGALYLLNRPNVTNDAEMRFFDAGGAQYFPNFDNKDAVYGKLNTYADGAGYYKNLDSGVEFWRIPKETLAGWDPSRPATQENHPGTMSQAEIARLPLGEGQQQRKQDVDDYAQKLADIEKQRRQIQQEKALQKKLQQLERERSSINGNGGGGDFDSDGGFSFGDMFSGGGDDGDDMSFNLLGEDFADDGGGSNMGSFMKMMMNFYQMQMGMQLMGNMMSMLPGSGGGGFGFGGGGGGGAAAVIGPLLNRQNDQTLVQALNTAKGTLNGLSFTSGGATGPEVDALRDAVVSGIEQPLAQYAAANSSAQMMQALLSPGAMQGGMGLAIALIPAPQVS